MSLGTLLPLAVETARAPRDVLARLLALRIPEATLWQALALVVVLSVILAELTNLAVAAMGMTVPTPDGDAPAAMVASPLVFGALQMILLIAMVLTIHWIGRAMGGSGGLGGAILAVAWLQFVMVCLQVVQSLVIILVPPLAGFIVLIGLCLFMWLLTNFIAELHGFRSLGRVFGMVLFVMIGVALALSFVLTLSGVTVQR